MNKTTTVFANNVKSLRKKRGLTQAKLAEALQYSDKAVSKWERGESVPDFSVVQRIAAFFGVSMEYLTTDHVKELQLAEEHLEKDKKTRITLRTKIIITAMCILLVWLIALIVYVVLISVLKDSRLWVCFIYALFISFLVFLIFNSIWLDVRHNYWIISGLMWSFLAALYFTLLVFVPVNIWLIFTLGIPGQIIIILWSRIRA